jgi:hypothetical protein
MQINDSSQTQMIFGEDVEGMRPDQAITVDDSSFGTIRYLAGGIRPHWRGWISQPIFDKESGAIDPVVAVHWKQPYDLSAIMQRDWATLKGTTHSPYDGEVKLATGRSIAGTAIRICSTILPACTTTLCICRRTWNVFRRPRRQEPI